MEVMVPDEMVEAAGVEAETRLNRLIHQTP
jgi:hypothetical protein